MQPHNPFLLTEFSRFLFLRGKPEAALADLKRAVAAYPNRLAIAFVMLRTFERPIREFQIITPDDPSSKLHLANTLVTLGAETEAATIFDELEKTAKPAAPILEMLANHRRRKKEYRKALALYQRLGKRSSAPEMYR